MEINLELLCECCKIPDFEKKAYGQHLNIIDKVFKFLTTSKKKIPNDYMKMQLAGLDKNHGNIDVLSHRISNVRTWSYVSNKKNWVDNSDYWIQITKKIEVIWQKKAQYKKILSELKWQINMKKKETN